MCKKYKSNVSKQYSETYHGRVIKHLMLTFFYNYYLMKSCNNFFILLNCYNWLFCYALITIWPILILFLFETHSLVSVTVIHEKYLQYNGVVSVCKFAILVLLNYEKVEFHLKIMSVTKCHCSTVYLPTQIWI